MAKTSVDQWDTTASNNSDVSGVNIAEGCAPGNINDALRNIMAQIAAYDLAIPRVDEGETVSGSWVFSGAASATGTFDFSGAIVTFRAGEIGTGDIAAEAITTGKMNDAGIRSFITNTSSAAAKIPYATGANTWAELDFYDEDDMASNSATGVASQQSVKAYADNVNARWELVETITPAGNPSTIETSVFASGYEYAIRFKALAWDNSDASSRAVTMEAYDGSSYHSDLINLSDSDANAALYGWLYAINPMSSDEIHEFKIATITAAGGTVAGGSSTTDTASPSGAALVFSTASQVTKIRIGRNAAAAFDLTGGSVEVYRRKFG